MNFDGFTPSPITRFSSLVETDDPTALPLGVAALARNVRYHLTSARTRDGLQSQWGFITPTKDAPITGLASLKVGGNPDTFAPVVYDQNGKLYVEQPAGSGTLKPLTSTQLTPPGNSSMQAAAAYKKGFFAFTDLKNSLGPPAVYSILNNTLDPLSMKPVGVSWAANTTYQVGEVVTPATPVGGNGHSYICTVAGKSGANQPAFPTTEGGTVAEGPTNPQMTWKENTPTMGQFLDQLLTAAPAVVNNPAAGAFPAGRDVYIAITLVNGNGETVPGPIFSFLNTALNDQFAVPSPVLPLWVQALTGANAVTGWKAYEADVAHGSAAPALSAFKNSGGLTNIGTNIFMNGAGAGAAPPVATTARFVPVGNICAGLRYAMVLYVSRTGYLTGVGFASVVSFTSPGNGFQLYMAYIPTGPAPQTAARIVAFTPAGQLSQAAGSGITSAGPYFWIPPAFPNGIFDLTTIAGGVTVADVVNGVSMTSTLINDNVTTTATFNFTDDYLKLTQEEISSFFRKIQVPNASDVYYSENLRRVFYAVDTLPSGWYVSLKDDPESIYGDTSILQVAENNGQNRVAVRDFQTATYLLKEESGHVLDLIPDNPSDWKPTKKWDGCGPCGPRAVDVGPDFMAFIHRSGAYVFKGTEPYHISPELQNGPANTTGPKNLSCTWARINWAVEQTFWTHIDLDNKEVLYGVALDGSTVPNKILKCNYEESPDFAPPIHFSPYIGKEIASGSCRKWSIDDIAANVCIRSKRTLSAPATDLDPATIQSQLLFGSADFDGVVSAQVPFVFNDNGGGFMSVYETVCPGESLRPSKLGGVQANVGGQGEGPMEVLALRGKDPEDGGPNTGGLVIAMKKKWQAGVPYSCGARGQNERFRLRISNGGVADVGFDLKWAAIYTQPISSARKG